MQVRIHYTEHRDDGSREYMMTTFDRDTPAEAMALAAEYAEVGRSDGIVVTIGRAIVAVF